MHLPRYRLASFLRRGLTRCPVFFSVTAFRLNSPLPPKKQYKFQNAPKKKGKMIKIVLKRNSTPRKHFLQGFDWYYLLVRLFPCVRSIMGNATHSTS